MNETPTNLAPGVDSKVVETDQDQEKRVRVEAGIADLKQTDRLLTALANDGLSTIEALEAASRDPALTNWTKSLVKQLSPPQMQQLEQEIGGSKPPVDSYKKLK